MYLTFTNARRFGTLIIQYYTHHPLTALLRILATSFLYKKNEIKSHHEINIDNSYFIKELLYLF